MKKLVLALTMVLGVYTIGSAQNDKIVEKAQEKAEEINAEIVAGDSTLALSADQMKRITEIHVKRITETRKLRKANADDDEIKEANKKYFKEIVQDVLTKEQRLARKEGKEK